MAEVSAESVQWSNADIEFPSTSTSEEIEIISQPDEAFYTSVANLTVVEEVKRSSQETIEDIENDVATLSFDEITKGIIFCLKLIYKFKKYKF